MQSKSSNVSLAHKPNHSSDKMTNKASVQDSDTVLNMSAYKQKHDDMQSLKQLERLSAIYKAIEALDDSPEKNALRIGFVHAGQVGLLRDLYTD